MRDLACAIHVHSTYSDGTATVPEIIAAAQVAELDAVLLTDHDSLGAKRDGWEGRHGSVELVVGLEVSPKRGHLLAFALEHEIAHDGLTERQIAEAVTAAGGIAFPAHPFSAGSRISTRIAPPHGWDDLDGPYAGIEVWSLLTDAAERCASPREFLSFVRRPADAMPDPEPHALREWDRLGRTRRVVGIGGLDAHQSGFRVRGRALSPFPHERIFRTLRTHVLCRDGEPLLDALAAGRCYLAVDGIGDARGFTYIARDWTGGEHPMGSELLAQRCVFAAHAPADADLRLVRDGAEVASARGRALEHVDHAPGVYRVEARRAGRTWVLSNPIYLR